jgi:hypothetical protein
MMNGQTIAVAGVALVLIVILMTMNNGGGTKTNVKESSGTACKRTGVVASQAEITGLQL